MSIYCQKHRLVKTLMFKEGNIDSEDTSTIGTYQCKVCEAQTKIKKMKISQEQLIEFIRARPLKDSKSS